MEALRMKVYFFFFFLINVEVSVFSLQRTSSPVNFSITQSPLLGVYTAKVTLGYPPQNFNVLIDTGSDITWVPCNSCNNNCSEASKFHHYNTSFSTSENLVLCQEGCACSNDHLCEFGASYEDQTSTSGYLIQDWFSWMDANTSPARITFGCSTYQSAGLLEGTGYDGILGFGRGPLSFPSQLGLNGFSHCFNLHNNDGFFLLGEALLPNLTYTPMVPSRMHFDLYLEKIMVNEQALAINPVVFKKSEKGAGTIIDSGTDYMFLIEEAYNELITVVNSFLPSTVKRIPYGGKECYLIPSSTILEAFPVISLAFAQNATLVLQPKQYLEKQFPEIMGNVTTTWCISILAWESKTILGATILKNKLVVYDVSHQRIGWVNFDCSRSAKGLLVNLSMLTEHNNAARQKNNIARIYVIYALLITVTILFY